MGSAAVRDLHSIGTGVQHGVCQGERGAMLLVGRGEARRDDLRMEETRVRYGLLLVIK